MNALNASEPRHDPNGSPASGVVQLRPVARIRTTNGAEAIAAGNEIQLLDQRGRLMARFDAETGNLTLHAAGDLDLVSAGALRLKSESGVEIESPRVSQRCEQYSLESDDVQFTVSRWRLRASRIFEHSTDVYRRVERVYETRAESIRSVARGALSLLAEKATLRSKDETRIDGKRVLLG